MNVVEPIKDIKDIRKIKAFLSKNKRDSLLFSFGINSDLRISNILALDVCDAKDKDYVEIKEKKTSKYKRFPLNKKLQLEIAEFVEKKNLEEPLFWTQKNRRLDRIQAYKILNKAAKNANVNIHIGTHSLRKTFGYHHYQKFKDVVLLQKIFNHSTPTVTLRYIEIEQDEIDYSYSNFIL